MSEFDCLANCSYMIDRKQLARVKMYDPTKEETKEELAAPVEPIIPLYFGATYYSLTHGARVAIQRADRADEITVKWVEGTKVVTGRITYVDESVLQEMLTP